MTELYSQWSDMATSLPVTHAWRPITSSNTLSNAIGDAETIPEHLGECKKLRKWWEKPGPEKQNSTTITTTKMCLQNNRVTTVQINGTPRQYIEQNMARTFQKQKLCPTRNTTSEQKFRLSIARKLQKSGLCPAGPTTPDWNIWHVLVGNVWKSCFARRKEKGAQGTSRYAQRNKKMQSTTRNAKRCKRKSQRPAGLGSI